MQEWKEIVQDRERWRDVVMAAKTLIDDDDDDREAGSISVFDGKLSSGLYFEWNSISTRYQILIQ